MDHHQEQESKGVDFDIFLSHAGEQYESHALPLYNALTRRGLKVWLYRVQAIMAREVRIQIEDGLRRSRYVLALVSRDYLAKGWPQTELSVALSEQVGKQREVLLLILFPDVTTASLKTFSSIAALLHHERIENYPSDEALADRVRKDINALSSGAPIPPPSPVEKERKPGEPFNSLPIKDYMQNRLPSLHMEFNWPQYDENQKQFNISWTVANIGVGAAKNIHLFVAGFRTHISGPILPGKHVVCTAPCRDMRPMWHLARVLEDSIIFEFEDIGGVVYRQDGRFSQVTLQRESEAMPPFALQCGELMQPFQVSERHL